MLKIFIAFLILPCISIGQNNDAEALYTVGNYSKLFEISKSTKNQKVLFWKAKAELDIGSYKNFLLTVNQIKDREPNKKLGEIVFCKNMALYYHHKLQIDSALFFTGKMISLTRGYTRKMDKSTLFEIYWTVANVARNGHGEFFIKLSLFSNKKQFLSYYLEKAYGNITTSYNKANFNLLKGLIFQDDLANCTSANNDNFFFKQSNICYQKAFKLFENPLKKARISALLGLSAHYTNRYDEAEHYYLQTEKLTQHYKRNEEGFLVIQTRGWRIINLLRKYESERKTDILKKAVFIGKKTLELWKNYYQDEADEYNGLQDGYWANTNQYLLKIYVELYFRTKHKKYFEKAFYYGQYTKYLSFSQPPVEIKKIQQQLKSNQCYVDFQRTHIFESQHYAFILTKSSQDVIFTHSGELNLPFDLKLYAFNEPEKQRQGNDFYFKNYLKPILKKVGGSEINEFIISNSDINPLLNFDVLFDPNTHKFPSNHLKFSYALTAENWLSSQASNQPISTLGVTVGAYKKHTNLLFSGQLCNDLVTNFAFKKTTLIKNIEQNDLAVLLVHGKTSLNDSEGKLLESDTREITSSRFKEQILKNALVVISACNSSLSGQYNSEGSMNNFPKVFMKNGVKAVLATSWEIDDKANAIIIKRFLHHLRNGRSKTDALFLAKKYYLAQCRSEEEKHPRYWAGYMLFGNTNSMKFESTNELDLEWVFIGIFGLTLIFYYRNKILGASVWRAVFPFFAARFQRKK